MRLHAVLLLHSMGADKDIGLIPGFNKVGVSQGNKVP